MIELIDWIIDKKYRFCFIFYSLLIINGNLHCLNHVETKDYLTSCDKPEQNCELKAGHCFIHGFMGLI